MKKQTSVFENSLIWFGAGVSIAENSHRYILCSVRF